MSRTDQQLRADLDVARRSEAATAARLKAARLEIKRLKGDLVKAREEARVAQCGKQWAEKASLNASMEETLRLMSWRRLADDLMRICGRRKALSISTFIRKRYKADDQTHAEAIRAGLKLMPGGYWADPELEPHPEARS